jgi:hypothetical protein
MANLLNNGRSINNITDAFKKIREYPHIISEYDTLWRIIENELYYILKYITIRDLNTRETRDELLCQLLEKTDKSIYLKTPEIKKIIKYFDYSPQVNSEFNWFIKNIERGYNPTASIISSAGKFFSKDNIDKIYNKYPNKINIMSIITTNFLINNVFISDNIQEINQIFLNYKFTQDDINEILNNSAFSNSNENFLNLNKNNENLDYIHRVISYKKTYNLTLNYKDIEHLSTTCNAILLKLYDKSTTYEKSRTDIKCKDTLNNIKLLCEKFTDEELIKYIHIILNKSQDISSKYINILCEYLNFDKINTENIHKLICKLPHFNTKFPRELFNKIYTETNTLDFITTLIVNSQNNLVLELISQPDKLNCTLDQIFNIAFDIGNIPIIRHFLNNKYNITEEMIINNNSSKLLDIINECNKHGIYITEKCFDHLVFNMFITTGSKINIKSIQEVSVYINDDNEFNKFVPKIEAKVNEYLNLEEKVLNSFNNTIEYLKTNKVTNELIILSHDRRITNYLYNRMEKERTIKKVIIKKVVKKSKDNI